MKPSQKSKPELLNDSNVATSRLMPSISQMIELLSADEKVNEAVAKIESGEVRRIGN